MNKGGVIMLRVWTKKLGQRHYTRTGMSKTLCGIPMLGNNYAEIIPRSGQEDCRECLKIIIKDLKLKIEQLEKELKEKGDKYEG